jgi:hypothetical protein
LIACKADIRGPQLLQNFGSCGLPILDKRKVNVGYWALLCDGTSPQWHCTDATVQARTLEEDEEKEMPLHGRASSEIKSSRSPIIVLPLNWPMQ